MSTSNQRLKQQVKALFCGMHTMLLSAAQQPLRRTRTQQSARQLNNRMRNNNTPAGLQHLHPQGPVSRGQAKGGAARQAGGGAGQGERTAQGRARNNSKLVGTSEQQLSHQHLQPCMCVCSTTTQHSTKLLCRLLLLRRSCVRYRTATSRRSRKTAGGLWSVQQCAKCSQHKAFTQQQHVKIHDPAFLHTPCTCQPVPVWQREPGCLC